MPPDDTGNAVQRREFLKLAGAGAGLILLDACAPAAPTVPGFAPKRSRSIVGGSSPDVVVIGAGVWGAFTAYHLKQMGANVTLVDAHCTQSSPASRSP